MLETVAKSREKLQVATMVDPATYAELMRVAEENERSLAAELRLAIKNHLADGGDR